MATTLPENWIFLRDGWAAAPNTTEDANYDLAMSCTNGDYQIGLISGEESWSGSTLKGNAKKWGSRYAQTRKDLEKRMKDAGVKYSFQIIGRRRVLCIGEWPGLTPVEEPCFVPEPLFEGTFTGIADMLA